MPRTVTFDDGSSVEYDTNKDAFAGMKEKHGQGIVAVKFDNTENFKSFTLEWKDDNTVIFSLVGKNKKLRLKYVDGGTKVRRIRK